MASSTEIATRDKMTTINWQGQKQQQLVTWWQTSKLTTARLVVTKQQQFKAVTITALQPGENGNNQLAETKAAKATGGTEGGKILIGADDNATTNQELARSNSKWLAQ